MSTRYITQHNNLQVVLTQICPEKYYFDELGAPAETNHSHLLFTCTCNTHNLKPTFVVIIRGKNRGHYFCRDCGISGDLVEFHLRKYAMSYAEAILDLAFSRRLSVVERPPPTPHFN